MSENRQWISDIFYPALAKYNEEEKDFHIQQSINAHIGWVNCIENYDIEPSGKDMEEMQQMYRESQGDIDGV